jgi:hypothetical protein
MINTNMPHILVVSFPRYFRVKGLVVRSPRPPVCQETSGGFHKWGIPNSLMVCNGKPEKNMDDDWGYLHFRKPPDPYSIPIKAHYIPI